MQQGNFRVSDAHEVISVTLGAHGRLEGLALTTGWRSHYQPEELVPTLNAALARARLEQLETGAPAAAQVDTDDGRLAEIVETWQRHTEADAQAAEAQMWAALNELEKSLTGGAEPTEVSRLSNAARNVSMAWDGLMLADVAFATDQIAERPAGWLNEAFAEIIAQTNPQEDFDGTQ